jgi:hypothetical protein
MKKIEVTVALAATGRNPLFAKIAKEMRAMQSVKDKSAKIGLRKSCVSLEYEGSKFYLVRDISEARRDAVATAAEKGFCCASALLETKNPLIKKLHQEFKLEDPKYKLKFKQAGDGVMKAQTLAGDKLVVTDSYSAGTQADYDSKYGQVSLISQKPSVELRANGRIIALTWGEALELAAELLEQVEVGYYG